MKNVFFINRVASDKNTTDAFFIRLEDFYDYENRNESKLKPNLTYLFPFKLLKSPIEMKQTPKLLLPQCE